MNTTSNYAFLLMAADNLAVSVNPTSPSWLCLTPIYKNLQNPDPDPTIYKIPPTHNHSFFRKLPLYYLPVTKVMSPETRVRSPEIVSHNAQNPESCCPIFFIRKT